MIGFRLNLPCLPSVAVSRRTMARAGRNACAVVGMGIVFTIVIVYATVGPDAPSVLFGALPQ